MTFDIAATKKTRGRPATGVGKPVQVRLQPALGSALDKYISLQIEKMAHAEAIRRILVEYLGFTQMQRVDELDQAITDWIARQLPPRPARTEAIRQLVEAGLKAKRK